LRLVSKSCVASTIKDHGRLDPDPAFTWSSLERASDERLVALARGGLDVAVEAIVRRYHATLVGHASRLLDPEAAEDAVQEGLVKGLASIQCDSGRIHLRSWLFQIVHSEAVNAARRGGTRDESRNEDDADEQSAEYRARVEKLPSIVVGINRPSASYAEASDRSREEVHGDLSETATVVEELIRRARASVRTAGGSLFPVQQVRSWFQSLSSPAMRGMVTAGAAAVVIATVAGAASLGTHHGSLDPGSTQPSASSSADPKPRVAGPRREGGTRSPAADAGKSRHAAAPDRVGGQSPVTSPAQPTPAAGVGAGSETRPTSGAKPKAKPSPKSDKTGEEVTVLGEKKGATGASGNHGTTGATGAGGTGTAP
jgi:DNA-directed RNA polymerase specialized sigma24 family protein